MRKFLVLILLIAVASSSSIGVTSFDFAYAVAVEEKSPLQISTEINLEQAAIILAIGLAGAALTAYEGIHKSGEQFNKGKFLIAVKRTAKISIPTAFTMMLAFPDLTVQSYIMVGLVIVLGAKMQHTKKHEIEEKPDPVEKVLSQPPPLPTDTTSVTIESTVDKQILIPKLGPVGAPYQTNFVGGDLGNTLPYGTNLWIKRPGVRTFVSAILRDEKGNVIQVDQSHINDEDGDITTTRLEMFGRDGLPLPRGKYSVATKGDSGPGDTQGNNPDVFFIV